MVTFTGLRHIHLKVTNVQRAALFYQEGLGMERVVTKYGGRMVILSTPGGVDALTVSEGSIGADVVRSGRAGDNGGIDHFGFTLADQSQVDRAVGRLVAAGATLVRVTEVFPGWPTAFLQDPDGYAFQI
jgi:catechol 2,3-dioxygenase-like lactoylglutathione lyase family enzyme